MCTVYTTLMYGLGLPVLFPIAALTFFNIYLSERLSVAYLTIKPPMYDVDLNDLSHRLLQWSPLVFFVFSYWMMGNKQMF